MPDSSVLHTRLFQALEDQPRVRDRLSLIIQLCESALEDLASLDVSIYNQFGSPVLEGVEDKGGAAASCLQELVQVVLGGTRQLHIYLSRCDFALDSHTTEDDGDFDFDLGGSSFGVDEITLSDDDIDDALGSLAVGNDQSATERWEALSSELTSLGYVLGSQLQEFHRRFQSAIAGSHFQHALRELDDVRDELTDGVFALLSTIFETYLGDVDRNELLPGHRDTLSKALLVRHALAQLRRFIHERNEIVQDRKRGAENRNTAFKEIVAKLASHFGSDAFVAMRPADQAELRRFHKEMDGKLFAKAIMTCEGLDKYLDSLAIVNRRDVLVKHDQELLTEIANVLEGAESLFHISPHGAVDLVRDAFDKSAPLYGHHDALDALLEDWTETICTQSDPSVVVAAGQKLATFAKSMKRS